MFFLARKTRFRAQLRVTEHTLQRRRPYGATTDLLQQREPKTCRAWNGIGLTKFASTSGRSTDLAHRDSNSSRNAGASAHRPPLRHAPQRSPPALRCPSPASSSRSGSPSSRSVL